MFRRKNRVSCTSCQRALSADAKVCVCGQPTMNLSFDERRRFEVQRWRNSRAEPRSA